MTPIVHTILLVFAFVFFLVSVFPQTSPYWNRLVSCGLAALALSMIPF